MPETANAEEYLATMTAEFPSLVNWGIYSCRHIAGSETWSQHAWGNAVDLHPPSTAYGDDAYDFANSNRGSLDIEHLLWQIPMHYDHIHADFAPNFVGVPPCAGGPEQGDTDQAHTIAQAGSCAPGTHLSDDGYWCVDDITGEIVGPPLDTPVSGGTPFGPTSLVQGILSGAIDAVKAIALFIGFLANPHNWLRLGMTVGGAILLLLGIVFMVRHTEAGKQMESDLKAAAPLMMA